jgi:hypothetical protein
VRADDEKSEDDEDFKDADDSEGGSSDSDSGSSDAEMIDEEGINAAAVTGASHTSSRLLVLFAQCSAMLGGRHSLARSSTCSRTSNLLHSLASSKFKAR